MKDPTEMTKAEITAELRALGGTDVAAISYDRMSLADLQVQLRMMRRVTGGITPLVSPAPQPVPTPVTTPVELGFTPVTPMPTMIEVPKVVHLNIKDARLKILDSGLMFDAEKVIEINDLYAEADEVIRQRPIAGEMVTQDSVVELTVNKPSINTKPFTKTKAESVPGFIETVTHPINATRKVARLLRPKKVE